MIYFRCSACTSAIRGDTAQAGLTMACPRCGEPNICPEITTGLSPLAAPRRPDVAVPDRSEEAELEPAPGASPSLIRIGVAVIFLTSSGWAAWNMFREPPPVTAPGGVRLALAPADQRQREILEQSIDRTPDPALTRVYDEINRRHFGALMPPIPVVWEPRLAEVGPLAAQAFTLEGMFGHIGGKAVILLNPALARDEAALRGALSHEMVHAYLHSVGDVSTDHGPAFQSTLQRLAEEGAFEGLVATPRERASLQAWLKEESARLDAEQQETRREGEWLTQEARELDQASTALNDRRDANTAADVAAWTHRRDEYNRRVEALNARVARGRTDASAFNAQVERYNQMLTYPDGLDSRDSTITRRQ